MTIFFQKSEKTLIGYWNEDPNSDQIIIEVRRIEKWLVEKIFGVKFNSSFYDVKLTSIVKVYVSKSFTILEKESL